MSAFSNYMEAQIVEHFLRGNALATPGTVYLALFEDDPGEDGSGTETSYTGYARQASTWGAVVDGQTGLASSVSFPANGNGSASVTITHAAIFDAASGGNMLLKGALSVSKELEVSDVISFAANSLTFNLD